MAGGRGERARAPGPGCEFSHSVVSVGWARHLAPSHALLCGRVPGGGKAAVAAASLQSAVQIAETAAASGLVGSRHRMLLFFLEGESHHAELAVVRCGRRGSVCEGSPRLAAQRRTGCLCLWLPPSSSLLPRMSRRGSGLLGPPRHGLMQAEYSLSQVSWNPCESSRVLFMHQMFHVASHGPDWPQGRSSPVSQGRQASAPARWPSSFFRPLFFSAARGRSDRPGRGRTGDRGCQSSPRNSGWRLSAIGCDRASQRVGGSGTNPTGRRAAGCVISMPGKPVASHVACSPQARPREGPAPAGRRPAGQQQDRAPAARQESDRTLALLVVCGSTAVGSPRRDRRPFLAGAGRGQTAWRLETR